MKRCLFFILSLILLLTTACTTEHELPATVMIEGKEYQKAFTDELYPMDDALSNSGGIHKAGATYCKYPAAQFDCYVVYGYQAAPTVYFVSDQFENAVSYYKDAGNYHFFCVLGNIHDENEQQVLEINTIDSAKFQQLLSFSKDNDYDPFAVSHREEGLIQVPIPDPDDWMAHEIHLFKQSKDGAFSTLKGYTFVLHENDLYLLYQYDFTDEEAPVMLLQAIPTDISRYFCSSLEELPRE